MPCVPLAANSLVTSQDFGFALTEDPEIDRILPLQAAHGDALDESALGEEEENDDGGDDKGRGGHE